MLGTRGATTPRKCLSDYLGIEVERISIGVPVLGTMAAAGKIQKQNLVRPVEESCSHMQDDDDRVLRGVADIHAHLKTKHKLKITPKVVYNWLESKPQQLPAFKMTGQWVTTAGRLRRHFTGRLRP